MERPNRVTIAGAAIGALALIGSGVVIATAGGTPETAPLVSSATEQPVSETSQSPGTPAPADDSNSAETTGGGDQSTSQDAVSREEAVRIAEQALAEQGTVPPLREVEQEHEHGRAVWEVEFGADHEVYVDVETGEVVKVEMDDDGDDDDDHGHDDRGDDDYGDDDHGHDDREDDGHDD